jgi:hypothetical protein
MADYCSSGVWAKSGGMMDLEELPISEQLAREIQKWCSWYEESQFYYSPEDRTVDFDTKAFNRQGVLLAVKLGKELPGWRVIFRPE